MVSESDVNMDLSDALKAASSERLRVINIISSSSKFKDVATRKTFLDNSGLGEYSFDLSGSSEEFAERIIPDLLRIKKLDVFLKWLLSADKFLSQDKREFLKSLVEPKKFIEKDNLPGQENDVIGGNVPTSGAIEPNKNNLFYHLVIPIFQEGGLEQAQFRFEEPKFYYWNQNKIEVQPLLIDKYLKDVDLNSEQIKQKLEKKQPKNKISRFIKNFVDIVSCFLKQKHPSTTPWNLTIEVFVPSQLLAENSQPLLILFGEDEETLLNDHSVVLGFSDRFDPLNSKSMHLYDRLLEGWNQRFDSQLNGLPDAKLTKLKWLKSKTIKKPKIEDLLCYAAFQCYGDYLKSKSSKERMDNWSNFVCSGMPLGLWIENAQLEELTIKQIFEDLINCNRFDFIGKLLYAQRELKRQHNCRLGISYEDLNYIPNIPTKVPMEW